MKSKIQVKSIFKKITITILCLQTAFILRGQTDEWHITAKNIDPSKYYGVTVANGMIGIISSPNPMQVKDVVLNGAFDTYGRGRVSNIMKVFSFANMNLEVDFNGQGKRLGRADITNYAPNFGHEKCRFANDFRLSRCTFSET